MGRRGFAPEPTVLKVIKGNPGKRPLNVREPKPKPIKPTCPAWLDAEAKREWKRIVPELDSLGLLGKIDRAALAGYCECWSQWQQASRILQEKGLTFKTPSGYMQQRPEVSIAQKSLSLLKGFCQEFGLTPSARSRIQTPEADDGQESPFDV